MNQLRQQATTLRDERHSYNMINEEIGVFVSTNLYPDNDIEASIAHWSKVTKLPSKNFKKTQIDKRKPRKRCKVV